MGYWRGEMSLASLYHEGWLCVSIDRRFSGSNLGKYRVRFHPVEIWIMGSLFQNLSVLLYNLNHIYLCSNIISSATCMSSLDWDFCGLALTKTCELTTGRQGGDFPASATLDLDGNIIFLENIGGRRGGRGGRLPLVLAEVERIFSGFSHTTCSAFSAAAFSLHDLVNDI